MVGTNTNPNYEWIGTDGNLSNTVTISYAGVTQPQIAGSYTFEKNSTVRPATPTGASFTYNAGSWTDVNSVLIDGTALTATEYTASGGTITIPNATLASKNLANGNHAVTATFTDSKGYQSESSAVGTATIAVKTTYTVSFRDHDGGTTLTSSTTIANQTTSNTTVPGFTYGNIKNLPTRPGYTLQGWATTQNASTATWTSATGGSASNTYRPSTDVMAEAGWNTTVYAVWAPVNPTISPKRLDATVGDDLTGSNAHAVGTLTMPDGSTGWTYTATSIGSNLPEGLTLTVAPDGKVTIWYAHQG